MSTASSRIERTGLMRIDIRTIPHKNQRYPTSGDWWWERDYGVDILYIRVSEMSDPRYEQLVIIHELVEALLCKDRGIREEDVDTWDKTFINGEPGDDPAAPYHKEHDAGCVVERLFAHEIGVDWDAYNDDFDNLEYNKECC